MEVLLKQQFSINNPAAETAGYQDSSIDKHYLIRRKTNINHNLPDAEEFSGSIPLVSTIVYYCFLQVTDVQNVI
jgi:hypothetical protein